MVSKIAVIALVAIVAVPILLGYGLNIETLEKDVYTVDDTDGVSVANLLSSGTAYHYIDADILSMNTNQDARYLPMYVKHTSTYTGMILTQNIIGNWNGVSGYTLSNYHTIYLSTSASNLDISIAKSGGSTVTLHNVLEIYYSSETSQLIVKVQALGGGVYTYNDAVSFSTGPGSGYVAGDLIYYESFQSYYTDTSSASTANAFIDISGGFYIDYRMGGCIFYMPTMASSVTLTLNLGSGADFGIWTVSQDISFNNNGNNWSVIDNNTNETVCTLPIFGADNSVYQITLTSSNIKIDYVGGWSKSIGIAQSYKTYGPFATGTGTGDFDQIQMGITDYLNPSNTPIMRIDAARVRSITYPVIDNLTFDPETIKDNPSTLLYHILKYGDSITFGGQTYAVSDGKITLSGHQIPLEGCHFASEPTGTAYKNTINGTVVSTTSDPSTITFNGSWGMGVDVYPLVQKTVKETKWIPGKFAWDGVDTNFKLVGLFACLGAFIGIGIYAKAKRASIWPLIIVCASAGMMFFFMI